MKLHWLRIGASQPLAGPHGLLLRVYNGLVAVGTPDFLLIAGKAFTIWSNLMTIFGVGVNAPARISATDPTFLMGANGTDPAKIAVNAQARALLTATTAVGQRRACLARPAMYQELSFCEHFLNTSAFLGSLTSTTSTGTITASAVDGRVGVVRIASSATATNNARSNIGYGSADNCIDPTGNTFLLVCEAAPAITLFDGTNTGRLLIGFVDTDGTGLPTDGAYFRSNDGGVWSCETKRNTVTTTVVTSATVALGVWHQFAIRLTAALAEFWVDGVLVASITTNLPGGAGRETGVCCTVQKTGAHTVNGAMDIDLLRVSIPALAAPT